MPNDDPFHITLHDPCPGCFEIVPWYYTLSPSGYQTTVSITCLNKQCPSNNSLFKKEIVHVTEPATPTNVEEHIIRGVD